MSEESNKPLTTSRGFDPTFYGLHTNQQLLVLALLLMWSLVFMASSRIFPDIHTANKISAISGLIEIIFGFYIGRSQKRLYRFECTWRFIFEISRGKDFIEKYAKGGRLKAKEFSHIKWIHKGGFIEYFFKRGTRPHNWGGILWLDAFDPNDLKTFLKEVEEMLIGVPDKTVLKTSVNVRLDLKNYAEAISIQLNNTGLPKIVRESMAEHEQYIKMAKIKSYENYMLVLIDYQSNPKKAKETLAITMNSISEILEEMKIHNHVLKSAEEVREAFYSQVTFNAHQKRRVTDNVEI